MTSRAATATALCFTTLIAVLSASAAPTTPGTPSKDTGFAPNRAGFDLRLQKARGSRQIESVRGRILYDFSGNACQGYALQFRQVSELESGEGKNAVTD